MNIYKLTTFAAKYYRNFCNFAAVLHCITTNALRLGDSV